MASHTKDCPLHKDRQLCTHGDCAWWNDTFVECYIVSIGEALFMISQTRKQAPKKEEANGQ